MNKVKKIISTYKWSNIYGEPARMMQVHMALDNRTKLMKKSIGVCYGALLMEIKNNYIELYTNPEDWNRVSKFILNKLIKDKNWGKKAIKEIYIRANKLITYNRKLKKINYSKKTNRELWQLYKGLVDRFVFMRIYSSLPTNLEMGNPVLTEYLRKKLEDYGLGNEELSQTFSILTTPLKFSYLKEKEKNFYRLALNYKNKNFEQELSAFTNKYTWINYAFIGTPVTKVEFKKEIENHIKEKIDFDNKIKLFKIEKTNLKKEQTNICKKFGFDHHLMTMLEYAREFVFLKFFRKGIFAESYYYSEFLLNEIASRLNTNLETIQGMMPLETKDALVNNVFDAQKIKQRTVNSWWLFTDGKTFELNDEEIKTVKNNTLHITETTINEIKGQVAMPGYATGRAIIVNTVEDMKKFKKGDILVARLTNPFLMPAMRMASAFVTDIGGLACHAAIVSREMKIPCVVGTNNGSKILKDGDMIEVNAHKGLVRIIKRHK